MRHGTPLSESLEPILDAGPMLVAAFASIVMVCFTAPGCRTVQPAPRVIVLSEHCRTIRPGETVPELPKGEPVFWLCTPTGLELMMPSDANIPDIPKED